MTTLHNSYFVRKESLKLSAVDESYETTVQKYNFVIFSCFLKKIVSSRVCYCLYFNSGEGFTILWNQLRVKCKIK